MSVSGGSLGRDVGRGHLGHRGLWLALYRRDVEAAENVVRLWLDRFPPQRLYLRLFEPALVLSGTMFGRGRITYRDEHFVTWHIMRLMRQVRHRFVPGQTTGPVAVATSAAQESHMIGLRMVCDFLQAANWQISWLTSPDRAAARQAVERLNPAAFLISIGLDPGITPAARLIADLRRCNYTGLIVLGGLAVNRDPSLVEKLGADLTAPNGLVLVRMLRKRGLGVPAPAPAPGAA